MQTQQETYLDFLGAPNTKMAIPVFQRIYTWSPWQCEELWDDICRAGRNGETHFIGSIVFTQEQLENGSTLRNIVDGQQRTTTVTLLMIALRDYLRDAGPSAGGLTAAQIENTFLYNGVDETRTMKFVAAPADHDTLVSVLEGTELPDSIIVSQRILRNFKFFKTSMEENFDADVVWAGLQNLFAIVVELGEGDNPQLIFEGINSKGMSLATSDLLRNKLFYGNDEQDQERLLDTYWEPIEALFEGDKDQSNFNAALRCWLVEKDSSLEKYTPYELYSGFRKYINESYEGSTEDLMRELFEHCSKFKRMIKGPMVKKHLDWATGETGFGKGYGVTVGIATSSLYNDASGTSPRGKMFP